jgi:hypothetical protein
MEQMIVDEIGFESIKELLLKGWMTHDSMWFFYCLENFDIEKTNKINRLAIKGMAKIEAKRLKEAFNIEDIKTFRDLQTFIESSFQVVKANFMDFTYLFPNFNQMEFKMNHCFAYEGVKRMGIADKYQCGIFDRIDTWFQELEIEFQGIPKVERCLMHNSGNCSRLYQFYFNK